MDKQKFMLFSERKKLAEEYEKWINTPLDDGSKIKDCALSVITFMQIKGFCKIPENAVVLTKKKDIQQYEWSKLVDKMGVIEFGEKLCKETAEKFAEKVHNLFNRDIKDSVVYTQEEKDILKDFVESIDEICKEITEGKV